MQIWTNLPGMRPALPFRLERHKQPSRIKVNIPYSNSKRPIYSPISPHFFGDFNGTYKLIKCWIHGPPCMGYLESEYSWSYHHSTTWIEVFFPGPPCSPTTSRQPKGSVIVWFLVVWSHLKLCISLSYFLPCLVFLFHLLPIVVQHLLFPC